MNARNLAHLHRLQAERLGPLPALRSKRHGHYHDLSWDRYRADALACAAALADAGVRMGDRVGLLAENRLEWLIADMGILIAGAINVPPHAPLTARQVQFQLADAGATWLFVSTREQSDKVRMVEHELPQLRGVVAFDREAVGPDRLSWDGFLQYGRAALTRLEGDLAGREARLGPDDLATIMYTSGTTGNPKGVMLTHGNLLTNATASARSSPHPPDMVVLNWLPFSHIYARTVDHYKSLVTGTILCLAECAETVVDNLADIHPTHMSSVPRLYEKVLAAVSCADEKETARRLRKVFGPRVEWLGSGGAPLPLAVAEAYQRAGILVLQGYGLTESAPVISFNRPEAYKLPTVGQALPGVDIKIAPDGEVLTRGPHVMKGYWNNPEATAEAIRDGWLHTGDLGSIDRDGFLTITGRKKELLVLSNGKKVVPAYLEGLIIGDPAIDQAVVCGEGKNYLVALVVPHWDNLRSALVARGVPVDESVEALAKDHAVRDLLLERIAARLVDVSSGEQVRKIAVLPRPLSVACEELTVSLKLRRGVVVQKYREQIEALYRE